MLFFWCAVLIFWCAGKEIESAVQTFAVSLPPYGESFDAFWQEFCSVLAEVLVLSTQCKNALLIPKKFSG